MAPLRRGAISPDRTLASALCPLPETPGDADDLAAAQVKRSRFAARPYRGGSHRDASRVAAPDAPGVPGLRAGISCSSPIIMRMMEWVSAVVVAISPVFFPCRSTAIRSEKASTSRSLWEMKMTESPFSTIERTEANSVSASCGVSTAVGSSSTRMHVAIECLEDLHPLPLAHREVAHLAVERGVEAGMGHQRFELGRAARRLRFRCSNRSVPSRILSMTREVLGQGEMLVHHADLRLDGRLRLAGRQDDLGAVFMPDMHRARIGRVLPEQHIHQRRLAGAVLAEQRQNFAACEIEVDMVGGKHGAETLGHAAQGKDGRAIGHRAPFVRSAMRAAPDPGRACETGETGKAGARSPRRLNRLLQRRNAPSRGEGRARPGGSGRTNGVSGERPPLSALGAITCPRQGLRHSP